MTLSPEQTRNGEMPEHPRTVDALVNNSLWMGKIRTAVSRFDINEDTDDLVADVVCQMLSRTKDGKNYVERWEPKLGSYSNWIYTFVNNICRKKYNRLHSNTGKALRYAGTIVEEPEDGESLKKGEIPVSLVPTVLKAQAEYNLLTEQILNHLRMIPAFSWVVYSESGYEIHDQSGDIKVVTTKEPVKPEFVGHKYQRDLATTFDLLSKGFEPKEIAGIYKTSITFVYSLIRKIRSIDVVQDWYKAELGLSPA